MIPVVLQSVMNPSVFSGSSFVNKPVFFKNLPNILVKLFRVGSIKNDRNIKVKKQFIRKQRRRERRAERSVSERIESMIGGRENVVQREAASAWEVVAALPALMEMITGEASRWGTLTFSAPRSRLVWCRESFTNASASKDKGDSRLFHRAHIRDGLMQMWASPDRRHISQPRRKRERRWLAC